MDIVMVVTVSVVIIGIITCLLYIDTLNQLLSVKRFFPKTKNRSGFSDILNYAAAVENGIIICKDGSFIAAYEYFTQDNASTSDEEQEQLDKTRSALPRFPQARIRNHSLLVLF